MAVVTLPAAWCYVIIVGAIVLGFLEGRRLSVSHSMNVEDLGHRAPYLYLLIPLSLVSFGGDLYLNFDPGLQWELPQWWVVHYVPVSRGLTLGILTLVFVLASVMAYQAHHPHKAMVVVLGMLFITAFLAWQYRHSQTIAVGPPRQAPDLSMILQTSASTCVAATGANIANHFGFAETEADMVRLYGTTEQGTSPGQVVYGMQQLGLSCRIVTSSEVLSLQPPAMLFVDSREGVETHAVALMAVRDGMALIWDPARGPFWRGPHGLARVWHGHAIEFSQP